jgi:5'-3' exonuclease
MERFALIDGDEVAFKAISVSADEIDWDNDGTAEKKISEGKAVQAAFDMLKRWMEFVEAEHFAICFSCRDRKLFRGRLLPSYKAGRAEKPPEYWAVVDAMHERHGSIEFPGLEADDVMGILSTDKSLGDPVVVSSDKDMKTLPGIKLFNPYAQTKKIVAAHDADYFWMYQTLTGDSTDGYKGCPKIGPVKAAAILMGEEKRHYSLDEMWRRVVATYAEKSLGFNDALTQARMARILRPGDVDHTKQQIRLWHPKGSDVWIPMEVH